MSGPRCVVLLALLAWGCAAPTANDDDVADDDDAATEDAWPWLTWFGAEVPGEGAIDPVEGLPEPERLTRLDVLPERAGCSVVRTRGGDVVEETYNAAGRLTERGTAASAETSSYDGADRIVGYTQTFSAPGERDRRADWVRDAEGLVVTETLVGVFDQDVAMARTWAEGEMLERRLDIGLDGVVDRVESYVFDAAGRRVRDAIDDDQDGLADSSRSYAYEQAGVNRPSRQGLDIDDDGTPEGRWAWTWNRDGLWVAYDDGDDGSVDERWTWDEQRRLIGFHGRGVDATYTWGAGRQTDTMEVDDGDPRTEVHTWQEGRLVRIEVSEGLDDGAVRSVETRTYDAAGRILQVSVDDRGDGTEDSTETWTWSCD